MIDGKRHARVIYKPDCVTSREGVYSCLFRWSVDRATHQKDKREHVTVSDAL